MRMTKDTGSELIQLTELHARSVNRVERLRQQVDAGRGEDDALRRAIIEERNRRAALVRWKPHSTIEAELKIHYMIMYLIKTKTSLDEREMGVLRASVAHLSLKWPW